MPKYTLTKKSIDKFRKDFLTLMKNTKRVKNYDQANELWHAIRNWRSRMEEFGIQLREELEDRDMLRKFEHFWGLINELISFPLRVVSLEKKYAGRGRSDEEIKEDLFDEYQRKVGKWENRIRRKARDAWKYLNESIEIIERKGGELTLLNTQPENVRLSGIQTQLVRIDTDDKFHQKALEKIKSGLDFYQKRARKVYPWLLRHQLPLVIHFEGKLSDVAATYKYDHIYLSANTVHSDKRRVTHTIAHEMGHHIYKTVLSADAQKTWKTFIRGDYERLDLRDVLNRAKPNENMSDLEERLTLQDPILYLQVKTLIHDVTYENLSLYSLRRIEKYLNEGGDPIVIVPAKPVTGYGAKNSEEAFCEVLGRLVGYGPRTVLEEVRFMFERLVPGVSIAQALAQRGHVDIAESLAYC